MTWHCYCIPTALYRLQLFWLQVGLQMSTKKTETMTLKVDSLVLVKGGDLSKTDKFTYIRTNIRPESVTERDIHNRLGKARNVFKSMSNVWRSTQYSTNNQTELIPELCSAVSTIHGTECWRMTRSDLTKLWSFHTTCLSRTFSLFWPEKISNEGLHRRCKQEDMDAIITRQQWRWLGYVLQREPQTITRTALHWTPDRKRKRGKQRTVEREMKAMQLSWGWFRTGRSREHHRV